MANEAGGRLFIACPVPEDVAMLLSSWLRQKVPNGNWRLTPPDQVHVTLLFLGETEAAIGAELIRYVSALDVRPGRAAAQALRRFGTSAVGVDLQLEPLRLADLGHVISGAGKLASRNPESFRPHLTLARIRNCAPDFCLPDDLPGIEFELGPITLYRSHLSPEGSRYERLAQAAPR